MNARIKQFDGLRALGAILIAGFVHIWVLVYPNFEIENVPFPQLDILYRYGDIAVEMFFMLSGFLMSMHHEKVFEGREYERSGGFRNLQKDFENCIRFILLDVFWAAA